MSELAKRGDEEKEQISSTALLEKSRSSFKLLKMFCYSSVELDGSKWMVFCRNGWFERASTGNVPEGRSREGRENLQPNISKHIGRT